MKKTIRGLLVTALVVVGGMVMSAGYAQCADEPLPPEVKKLIGTPLPSARTLGWKPSEADGIFVLEEPIPTKAFAGLYRSNLSILVITNVTGDSKNRTVLDAKVLPQSYLEYLVKGGKLVMKKDAYINESYFKLSGHCKSGNSTTVVALVRPEPNVSMGWSERVKLAWEVDIKTGHLKEISTQGVSCFIETGDD